MSRRWLFAPLLASVGLTALGMAAAPPHCPRLGPFALLDPAGETHTQKAWADHKVIVLFFLGTECPVSNSYSPEMARLAQAWGPKGVLFQGIYPDPDVTRADAARHAKDYALPFPVLLDPRHTLAGPAGVELVPEAVVLTPDGVVRYRGRIDDRYGPTGRRREVVRERDVDGAVADLLAGRPVRRPGARGFGCPLPEPARKPL